MVPLYHHPYIISLGQAVNQSTRVSLYIPLRPFWFLQEALLYRSGSCFVEQFANLTSRMMSSPCPGLASRCVSRYRFSSYTFFLRPGPLPPWKKEKLTQFCGFYCCSCHLYGYQVSSPGMPWIKPHSGIHHHLGRRIPACIHINIIPLFHTCPFSHPHNIN